MKRRDFVLSGFFVAMGSFLVKGLLFEHPTDDSTPIKGVDPVEFSPVPERTAHVERTGKEGLILAKEGGDERIELNSVGSLVWEKIDGKASCNHIADSLATDYGMEYRVVLADIKRYVTALEAEGYVRIVASSPCYALSSAAS